VRLEFGWERSDLPVRVRNPAQFMLARRMEFLENAFIETIQTVLAETSRSRSFFENCWPLSDGIREGEKDLGSA
jgi:hypothetical protein